MILNHLVASLHTSMCYNVHAIYAWVGLYSWLNILWKFRNFTVQVCHYLKCRTRRQGSSGWWMLRSSVSVANNLFLTAWSQLGLLFRSNVGIHGIYDGDCIWSLSKGRRDFSSPGLVQPESEAIHLPASGAEVKMRGTSIRLHGVVLVRTSCFSEELCAKSLSVGLFHC